MPRLMSVSFTEQQVRDRSKTVTRRKGWANLEPGDFLTLCRKVMGRRKGEPLVRIVDVEVVSVRREPLSAITADDVAREGFPGMFPVEFVRRFFVEAQRMHVDDEVTRVEWRYRDGETCGCRSHNPTRHHAYGPCGHCGTDAEFDCESDCPVGQIVASWEEPAPPALLEVSITLDIPAPANPTPEEEQ
jgi:hypothetical protein